MDGCYKLQIRGKIEHNAMGHFFISFVICRGQDYSNAKGNNEEVACPSDVTEWQYYDNGWQDAGEDISVSCGSSIEERLETVEYWVWANDDRLKTLECRDGIEYRDAVCQGRFKKDGYISK